MEGWRRPICNSLGRARISPATGAKGQAIQVRCLDLACGRPGLYLSPLLLVSSVGIITPFLLHTPSCPPPLPGCMLWNGHCLHRAPLFWSTVVRAAGSKCIPCPGPCHQCPDSAQCPREVSSSVMPRFFLEPVGGWGWRTKPNQFPQCITTLTIAYTSSLSLALRLSLAHYCFSSFLLRLLLFPFSQAPPGTSAIAHRVRRAKVQKQSFSGSQVRL